MAYLNKDVPMTEIKKEAIKWYYRPTAVLVAVFFLGPFALPVVWRSPAFSRSAKIGLTILMIALTLWFVKLSFDLYQALINEAHYLQNILK